MAKYTVILTTFNRQETLKKTLVSLENQSNKNFEINIVDDGSEDGTKDFCKDYLYSSKIPCRYIRLDKEGYNVPQMRNIGAKFAEGKYLIFLDDDIITVPQWIQDYENHFEQNSQKVVLGRLLYVTTDFLSQISFEDIKNKRFNKLQKGLISDIDPRKGVLKDIDFHSKVWGGNLGIKKSIFYDLNGIDEDFVSWGGFDEDFGLRLLRQNYCVSLVDDCTGYHLGTNFKSLEEIAQEPSIKLLNEIKKYDSTTRRNINNINKKSFLVSVLFDGNKFPTELYKNE